MRRLMLGLSRPPGTGLVTPPLGPLRVGLFEVPRHRLLLRPPGSGLVSLFGDGLFVSGRGPLTRLSRPPRTRVVPRLVRPPGAGMVARPGCLFGLGRDLRAHPDAAGRVPRTVTWALLRRRTDPGLLAPRGAMRRVPGGATRRIAPGLTGGITRGRVSGGAVGGAARSVVAGGAARRVA
ncbi:hypothetical protein N5079_20515 [Planotetraspora sp. A-T 1434]|uniref:hypothetical protein n=1 Tax=Planotetraspora sp. A-T 1434 TaxID=2979219 RepID=UPI0021C18DA7|nr:hypothetical protein [Planotetraspora sp. A-T 1434]MCT9932588.1 hypothetical protein [Planotetraspora sp. A-T 1434]